MSQGLDMFQGVIREFAAVLLELADGGLEAIEVHVSRGAEFLVAVIQELEAVGLGDLIELGVEELSRELFLLELDEVLLGGVSVVFAI